MSAQTRTTGAAPSARQPPKPRRKLSRRIDQVLLRWQARLDAAWADRVVPWVGAGLLFTMLFGLALARASTLMPGEVLGTFSQAAWLISTGNGAEPTITGDHLLAAHTPLAFWPIAWLTGILPTVPTLLGIQSAALAVGVVPLWRLARRVVHLRVGAAATLGVAYGLHPAVQNLNLADFHPQTLAVAPLLAATYYGLEKRWPRFWAFAVITVLCGAELGLVVGGLGLLLMLGGSRRNGIRAIGFGVGWTLVAVLVVQPVFGDAALVGPEAFGDYGNSALGAIGAMLGNPFQVLGDIFSESSIRLLIGVLAPLLFLPLLAPRYLIPGLPLQVLYLLAAVPLSGPDGAQHLVPTIPFALVAATFALSRIGRRNVERVVVDRRVLIALVLAAVGFFALDAASSPYRTPWAWGNDTPRDAAADSAVEMVAAEEAVRASPALLPRLAERTDVYLLELPGPNAGRATRGVTATVLDGDAIPDWTTDDSLTFFRAMAARGWELVFRQERLTVWMERDD
ncbi:MAG: DUF2079 domain-containing protein [Acidimicrobiales bacterium]